MKFKEIIHSIVPPPQWRVPVIISAGVLFGIGFVILHIANATSYLSDNPRACINCHVMTTQYASWQRSSHARVATCNDCHVPQDNFIRTYAFKASDGLRHATMFTFRLEPQVIKIKEAGANVVQENCERCHGNQVHRTYLSRPINLNEREDGVGKFCWDCHRETPHGRVKSLSAYPHARIPQLEPVIPKWLENFNNTK
ncbi:MAG: cytochrome c nitrite reductase small subunit [Ignavibacteriaceae bacterium]